MSNTANATIERWKLTKREVLAKFPDLTYLVLLQWVAACKVDKFSSERRNRVRYDVRQVAAIYAKWHPPRPAKDYPRFVEDGITYVARRAAVKKYGCSFETFDKICKRAGIRHRSERVLGRGTARRLHYFNEHQLAAEFTRLRTTLPVSTKPRQRHEIDALPDETYILTREAQLLGWDDAKLYGCVSHPALAGVKGGRIRRSKQLALCPRQKQGDIIRQVVTWRLGDIRAVEKWRPDGPEGMTKLREASKETGLAENTIRRLIENGTVRGNLEVKGMRSHGHFMPNMGFVDLHSLKQSPEYRRRQEMNAVRWFAIDRTWYHPLRDSIAQLDPVAQGKLHADPKYRTAKLMRWCPSELGGGGQICPFLGRMITCERVKPGYRSARGDSLLVLCRDDLPVIEAGLMGWEKPRHWAHKPPFRPDGIAANGHEVIEGIHSIRRMTKATLDRVQDIRECGKKTHEAVEEIKEKTTRIAAAPAGPDLRENKGGRPPIDPKEARFRYRIAREYRASGQTRRQFALGRQWPDGTFLHETDVKAILQWVKENPEKRQKTSAGQ